MCNAIARPSRLGSGGGIDSFPHVRGEALRDRPGYRVLRETSYEQGLFAGLSGGKLTAIDGPHALTQATRLALSIVRSAARMLRRSPLMLRSPRPCRASTGRWSGSSVWVDSKRCASLDRPVPRIGRDLAQACHANLSAVAGTASYVPFDQLGSRRSLVAVVEALPTATMAGICGFLLL